jgi:hypothetical protein
LRDKTWNTTTINDKQNNATMKANIISKAKTALRMGSVLLATAVTLAAQGGAAPLNARLISRPLTPGDVSRTGMPASTEYSGGLNTVGVGTPVYLEVDVNLAFPAAAITNVSFAITQKPLRSGAVITTNVLPASLGVFEPADQLVYQVAGRAVLRPDLTTGEYPYIVTATIGTTTAGTTNVTLTINAGTYLGVGYCTFCHGANGGAPPKVPLWETTAHASIFTQGIDGVLGSHYSQSCLQCHTVGYDTNAASFADNGFYATAQAEGWVFPAVLTNSNFASMETNYPDVANLGNIQCENCHGPASEHAYSFGNTNAPGWPRIAVSTNNAGTCNQCHDDPTHHVYGTQWLVSAHSGALSTEATIPSGNGRDQCVMCHTAYGFVTRINNTISNSVAGGTITNFAPTNTVYASINCQTCHEPHGGTVPTNNPHLIRTLASVTLGDGTVVTNAGEAELCLECHHSRDGGASNNVALWSSGQKTWAGASIPPSANDFGPHDGVQGDMIEAANAITYGLAIPSSAHRLTVSNVCVGCHMQTISSSDPGFLLSGEHTFEMSYNVTNAGVVSTVDQVAVCNQCHGGITNFNFPVEDYANTGTIQGVQTEVQILLNQLSTLLPNSSGVVDGTVKTKMSVTTNWTQAQLQAAYNWQYVNNDGSMGVHNAPFATGLLKASIANLTGVSVPGGLPDAWVIAYFGSVSNPQGAPNADPAGDGIPNWLKYSLGLNPLVKGISLPNGVVEVNASGDLLGSTNTVQIYTAADVTWNTVAGTSYQVQAINFLGGGWQNIGSPIVATNTASMSYLTPTRGTMQQFYRVVHTP